MSAKQIFVFINQLEDKTHRYVMVDKALHLAEPSYAPLEEIATLTDNQTEIIAVIHSHYISQHWVNIPTLKQANKTIPYALEDKLVSPIESLYFAYDSKLKQNGAYLVSVIDKLDLQAISELFTQAGLRLLQIIPFGIYKLDQCFITKDETIINTAQGIAHLDNTVGKQTLLEPLFTAQTIHLFKDSAVDFQPADFNQSQHQCVLHEETFINYFIQSFQTERMPSVLTASYSTKDKQVALVNYLKYSALGMVATCCVLISNYFIQYSQLVHQDQQQKKQIAKIYYDFFPGATEVISPRFRIEQFLKRNAQGEQASHFLELVQTIAPILSEQNAITIKTLNFNQKSLLLGLQTNNLNALNLAQTQIQNKNLIVKQLSAEKKDEILVVNWEITL